MMTPVAVYARRKAGGVCVGCGIRPADLGVVQCPGCREADRQRKAVWAQANPALVRAATARAWEAKYLVPGPNLLACCNRWHAIDAVPYTVPCCGTTYLKEEPDARA